MSDGFKDAMNNVLFGKGGPLEGERYECGCLYPASEDHIKNCMGPVIYENVIVSGKPEIFPLCSAIPPGQAGLKYDQGKDDLSLVPPSLDEAVGSVLTLGARKYARENWRKGINYSRIVASMKRHLNEFLKGNLIDKESGKPHLHHLAANVAFLIEFESKPETYAKFDDLYKGDK